MRIDVLGVEFDDCTMEKAVEMGMEFIARPGADMVVTPNPEIVMLCRADPELSRAVSEAALVIPDGIGVIYGSRILRRPLHDKVPGADFAEGVMAELAKTGGSVYLFGAKPGVADMAAEKLRAKYPGLRIAGTSDGYFDDPEPIIKRINDASPDFLLVCLGAPKQELWMYENRERLNVRLMAGLGGSLDVYAGVIPRAPKLWRRLDLEWLYRLLKQPSRIGRMVKLPRFIFAAFAQRREERKNEKKA